ncbi:MAG: hypothetical protein WCK65_13655, partial [Rhodospirillaceae bacterium]
MNHTVSPVAAQGQEVPTVQTVQREAVSRLRAAGIESAPLDARILVSHAFALSREQLLCRSGEPVLPAHQERFEQLLLRRLAREPVSRILGRREFWSLEFVLVPETLDPRPDSETVVEAGLAALAG